MLEEQLKYGFISDNDDSVKGKSGGYGQFGLNTGNISHFAFNPYAGRDGTEMNAIDVTIKTGEKEYRKRFFEISRLYGKGGEIADRSSAEYKNAYKDAMGQLVAVMVHLLKAVGVTETAISNALKNGFSDFSSWAKVVTSLAPLNYAEKPVDFFLEYQWEIQQGQNKTYLELPKNMKGGKFLCPHIEPVGGSWTEQRTWQLENPNKIAKIETMTGLRYIDAGQNIHPFKRDKMYMESRKAIQQNEEAAQAQPQNQGNQTYATNPAEPRPVSHHSAGPMDW